MPSGKSGARLCSHNDTANETFKEGNDETVDIRGSHAPDSLGCPSMDSVQNILTGKDSFNTMFSEDQVMNWYMSTQPPSSMGFVDDSSFERPMMESSSLNASSPQMSHYFDWAPVMAVGHPGVSATPERVMAASLAYLATKIVGSSLPKETQDALLSSAPSSMTEAQSLMILLQSHPRRRGRPRKNPYQVDKNEVGRRPRGRPRKKRPSSENEDDLQRSERDLGFGPQSFYGPILHGKRDPLLLHALICDDHEQGLKDPTSLCTHGATPGMSSVDSILPEILTDGVDSECIPGTNQYDNTVISRFGREQGKTKK